MSKLHIERYFYDSDQIHAENKKLVLVIYDIVSNKRRTRFVKLLENYGFRVQKSAFEAVLRKDQYELLIRNIPSHIAPEDNVRVYRLPVSGDVTAWGGVQIRDEDVVIL